MVGYKTAILLGCNWHPELQGRLRFNQNFPNILSDCFLVYLFQTKWLYTVLYYIVMYYTDCMTVYLVSLHILSHSNLRPGPSTQTQVKFLRCWTGKCLLQLLSPN